MNVIYVTTVEARTKRNTTKCHFFNVLNSKISDTRRDRPARGTSFSLVVHFIIKGEMSLVEAKP